MKLDRNEFAKIKKIQEAGKDPEIAVKKTGWSKETVRLAYKYASFSGYRRKVLQRVRSQAKRREERREDARMEKALEDFYTTDSGQKFLDPYETIGHSGYFKTSKDRFYEQMGVAGDELRSIFARAYSGIMNKTKETRICTHYYQYFRRSASSLYGWLRRFLPRTSSESSSAASKPAGTTASRGASTKRSKGAAKSS